MKNFLLKEQSIIKNCHNIAERKSYQKNKVKRALQKKIYNETYLKRPEVIELRKAYKKTEKYKLYARNYVRTKLQNNLEERLKTNIRNRIRHSVKKRNECSAELLGCPIELFIEWLEFNFDENMSWDNYGSYWHMDHITPCGTYEMTNLRDRLLCFNWSNVAPMEGRANERKHNHVDEKLIYYYDKRLKIFTEKFIEEHIKDW